MQWPVLRLHACALQDCRFPCEVDAQCPIEAVERCLPQVANCVVQIQPLNELHVASAVDEVVVRVVFEYLGVIDLHVQKEEPHVLLLDGKSLALPFQRNALPSLVLALLRYRGDGVVVLGCIQEKGVLFELKACVRVLHEVEFQSLT